MATTLAQDPTNISSGSSAVQANGHEDPFSTGEDTPGQPTYTHRYGSRLDSDISTLGAVSSPSHVKRVLESHIAETERRLQEASNLGKSLLDQHSKLEEKLRLVEKQQDEVEISPELRKQVEGLAKEYDDVSRQGAKLLLAPQSRVVSGEERTDSESGTYTSQATGSPTKISAPSRRQRNQPKSAAVDLQFATDISQSLLIQVRNLQAELAERDEKLKLANSEQLKLEQDAQGFVQRIRELQDHEQRYKDENWSLETRNHELQSVASEATEKERRFNASLAAALAEKSRLQNEVEEIRSVHGKLTDEHTAARKAHENELHSLKKDVDAADSERTTLQNKILELTSQNQELARAVAGKYRNISPHLLPDLELEGQDLDKDVETPEHSPPPSPTKATPRHGGLESETMRSSLHHAHRVIQNLKGTIHREKTEKLELKRMLQDARDELEQGRAGTGSNNKRQKARNEVFKKPVRSDMLGASRRSKTDVELDDDDEWEDRVHEGSSSTVGRPGIGERGFTDLSDAYQTAHESESAFETADERRDTESEAFETGAESLAGDSTEGDLTETESTAPNRQRVSAIRVPKTTGPLSQAGSRSSYYSTASTSADEEDDHQTPMQAQPKFRLKNGRSSITRQPQTALEGTPDSVRTATTVQDSPATVTQGASPPAAGQSLFAELGGLDDAGSDAFGTPARSSISGQDRTPGSAYTPSKTILSNVLESPLPPPTAIPKPLMVDSGMMTEVWQPEPIISAAPAAVEKAVLTPPTSRMSGLLAASSITPAPEPRAPSPSDFPLPPSVPVSPVRNTDTSTQYTPQRMLQESPLRNTTFITPPKTVWDEASEAGSPMRSVTREVNGDAFAPTPETPKQSTPFSYSDMLTQHTAPVSPPTAKVAPPQILAYSAIQGQHTTPVVPEPVKPAPVLAPVPRPAYAEASTQSERPKTSEKVAAGVIGGGLLATAATALGFRSKENAAPAVLEDETSEHDVPKYSAEAGVLQDISGSTTERSQPRTADDDLKAGKPVRYSSNDSGAQTMLTAKQIEEAMRPKAISTSIPTATVLATGSGSPYHKTVTVAALSPSTPKSQQTPDLTAPPIIPALSPNRPGSASSSRSAIRISDQQHPPLPADFKSNIERAGSILSQNQKDKAPQQPGTTATTTIMGPPLMPASAMRRPKTPSESMRSPTRDNATPRVTHSSRGVRGTMSSQLSRRSSVSSFASELDERFNIRPGDGPSGSRAYEGAPNADPRMIQAITQTMIGEYLWKYTRKTVGSDFSNTRHRRYFWVHPYNKTLHWQEHDPHSGQHEEKSRGVLIKSVRVITDDNPMPPGLHRKSLEITTPTRKIRFTASTGQRHETWFNALSYLLLRTGDIPEQQGAYVTNGSEITRDDLNEFTVGGYSNAHLVPTSNSRLSMSSYNSRTTRGTNRASSRQAMPTGLASSYNSKAVVDPHMSSSQTSSMAQSNEGGRTSRAQASIIEDRDRTIRARSMSRVSKMFNSMTGRTTPGMGDAATQGSTSRQGHRRAESENSIYDASVVSNSARDSAEEMRQEMLNQEEMGLGINQGLENVRACCDGKHDVSTLMHNHRSGERHRTLSSMSDRLNRSMSKRLS